MLRQKGTSLTSKQIINRPTCCLRRCSNKNLGRSISNFAARDAADITATKEKLKFACLTKSTSPNDVVELLKDIESAHKESSLVEDFPQILSGTWRLVFSVPAPIPSWAYLPVVEDAIIDVSRGTIALKSYVGPFEFTFAGKINSLTTDLGNSDMVFGFDSSEVKIFEFKWQSSREQKMKTYSFFLADRELAAVNSSATGGKTLLYRLK